MKYFNSTLFLILLLSFTSCQIARLDKPEGKPGTEEDAIIGTYHLETASWASLPWDYNNDGVTERNLLKEFKHMIGYWEPNHIAVVEKAVTDIYEAYKESAYAVNVKIPYPLISILEGKYCVNGVSYLNTTFRYNTNKEAEQYKVNSFSSSDNDLFVSNIKQAYVEEISFQGIYIAIACEMYDVVKNRSSLGTFQLHYVKDSNVDWQMH